MEEYKFILHQEIYLDDVVLLNLGSRSQVLSDNALRDGQIHFSYILGDLNDIEGFTSDYIEPINDFSDNLKSLFHYSVHNSLEIQRGTKQNGTIYFEYDISSYLVPNIPTDSFHYELTLKSHVFPSTIHMQHTSTVYHNQRVFLLLKYYVFERCQGICDICYPHTLNAAVVVKRTARGDIQAGLNTTICQHGCEKGRLEVPISAFHHLQVLDHTLGRVFNLDPERIDHVIDVREGTGIRCGRPYPSSTS